MKRRCKATRRYRLHRQRIYIAIVVWVIVLTIWVTMFIKTLHNKYVP